MKKLIAAVVVSAFAVLGSRASIFIPMGPAVFNLNAYTQQTGLELISSKTNMTATATNITELLKATVSKTPFASSNLVALLENSFNTNFPAGSQIGIRFGTLMVVDSTGTNVIFDPSDVISFQFDEEFISGTETVISTQNASGQSQSGNVSEVFTSSATLNYDDTAANPADGQHTKFGFKGFYVLTYSANIKTQLTKVTSVFQGTGGGPVRGVYTVLTGTFTVKASGVPAF
jgi:hypothetical protein